MTFLIKKSRYIEDKKTNKGTIIFYSKFIYNFINDYLDHSRNKSLTVRLKDKRYDDNFLKGFLLGIALSDGYVKEKFILNSISEKFADDVFRILEFFNFEPRRYLQNRKKYGEHDQHRIVLNLKQTIIFKRFLDNLLYKSRLGYNVNILKGY